MHEKATTVRATTTAASLPCTWRTRSKRALPRKCSTSIEKRFGGLTPCTCLSSLGVPLFSAKFTLWEIRLKKAIPAVCHLTQASASAVGVFPSLMLNPSQDYEHLKDRRAFLESNGYNGIQAPSSRSVTGGDKIQELIDKHFKFYKQINDDDKFSRFFLDWLFERYLEQGPRTRAGERGRRIGRWTSRPLTRNGQALILPPQSAVICFRAHSSSAAVPNGMMSVYPSSPRVRFFRSK